MQDYRSVCLGHLDALLIELSAHKSPLRRDQHSALHQLAAAFGGETLALEADELLDVDDVSGALGPMRSVALMLHRGEAAPVTPAAPEHAS